MTATETETPADVEGFDADTPEDSDGQTAIIDRSQYESEELALPKIDGELTDKIAVKFAGTVLLDRSAAADVALMRELELGKPVSLRVAGKVAGKGWHYTTAREGELDAIVLASRVKVEQVWMPVVGEVTS